MNYLIWDFDGTLAYREGLWTGTLLELLAKEFPGRSFERDRLRPYVKGRFPWHRPEVVREPGMAPDAWWESLTPIFEEALTLGAGLDGPVAVRLARGVREQFLRIEKWRVFDDTVAALERLGSRGWRHIILSNHVPELDEVVSALGLRPYFDAVFCSALTGVEKPNPRAFEMVAASLPPDCRKWMIGDNMAADVLGAEAVGIPGILARRENPDAPRFCSSLLDVESEIEKHV